MTDCVANNKNIQSSEVCPKVSVVMPSYNCEQFIEQSVLSVLNQTFTDFELIIIDDKSKDGTVDIIKKLADKDSRIQLVINEKNLGAAGTRNKGMDLCRGEYVALLDSDDLWLPEKLEIQLALAEKEKADIVYCSYEMIDEEGNKKCRDFIVGETITLEQTMVRCEFSCTTVLLSKHILENYRFTQEYYHEDLVFWFQLMRDGLKAVGTKQVLAKYRLHKNSRSANKIGSAKKRWVIYRSFMGLSVFKTLRCLMKYTIAGLAKYKNIK